MADITNWRERELNIEQVAAKYPDVPYLIILKIDIKRRGVIYTERALEAVDPEFHLVQAVNINTDEEMPAPLGFLLRDGSSVCETHIETYPFHREPYVIDHIDLSLIHI